MILNKMKVGYWLMYGSIWGVLRIGRFFLWDNDVDIGFYGEDRFVYMILNEFIVFFKVVGFKVKNKWI